MHPAPPTSWTMAETAAKWSQVCQVSRLPMKRVSRAARSTPPSGDHDAGHRRGWHGGEIVAVAFRSAAAEQPNAPDASVLRDHLPRRNRAIPSQLVHSSSLHLQLISSTLHLTPHFPVTSHLPISHLTSGPPDLVRLPLTTSLALLASHLPRRSHLPSLLPSPTPHNERPHPKALPAHNGRATS